MIQYFTLRILPAALLIAACSQIVYAQNRFKVLAVRGQVKTEAKAISVGQHLKNTEKITVPASGYIGLAHTNGRTVEIRKAGTYKVADLDKAAQKKTGSATSKFAAYVMNELTEVNEPISFSSSRRANMKTTGSVDRVEGDEVNLADSVLAMVGAPGELQALAVVQNSSIADGTEFNVIMPRHTRLKSDSLRFVWHRSPKVREYKVVVVDASNAVAYSTVCTDTTVTATTSAMGISPGKPYYWHLENSQDPSYRTGEYALYVVPAQERVTIDETVAAIHADMDEDESAIGMIILASAFEDMGLTYDAYRAYTTATALAPDVQNYKRLFAEFLKRQGLNLEAYLAYR